MKKAYREMYTLRTARDRLGLTQKEAAKKLVNIMEWQGHSIR